MKICPVVGSNRRLMCRTTVDFPLPDKPMMQKISPSPTEKLTSATATTQSYRSSTSLLLRCPRSVAPNASAARVPKIFQTCWTLMASTSMVHPSEDTIASEPIVLGPNVKLDEGPRADHHAIPLPKMWTELRECGSSMEAAEASKFSPIQSRRRATPSMESSGSELAVLIFAEVVEARAVVPQDLSSRLVRKPFDRQKLVDRVRERRVRMRVVG